MTDSGLAVQSAVHARLVSALSIPVYDAVPPDAPDRYVTIGEDTITDVSAKDISGQEIVLTIHVWDSVHRGRGGVKSVQAQIYLALHNAPVTVAGFAVSYCYWENSLTFLDEDGLTLHGVQTFRIRVLG